MNGNGMLPGLMRSRLPIWVMEPLHGGKLAKLSGESEALLKALRPEEEIPAWAFRFLQSVEGVTVTLSGMSDMEQMKENIHTYETELPLSAEEMHSLMAIADAMRAFTEKLSQPAGL